MSNELQAVNNSASTAMVDPKIMSQRIKKMHELMASVMSDGVHYGKIPGCPKPSLWLPGAQVIKVAFKIASRYEIEDLSAGEEKRYRVTAEIYSQETGAILGHGVGECSSNEEKYAWRKAVCDEEFESVLEERKRVKYGKGKGGGFYTENQIRTNPSDIANTVLKMAAKRADIHGTINTTAASEVFTQDLEDLPEGYYADSGRQSTKPAISPEDVTGSYPQSEATGDKPTEAQRSAGKLISVKQAGLLRGQCKQHNVDTKAIAIYCQKPSIDWLTWDNKDKKNFAAILKTVQEKPEFFAKFKQAENTQPAEVAPTVMDQEQFQKEVASHLCIGYTMGDFDEDLSMIGIEGGIESVTADRQQEVLAMLAKQEQAGA